jgi:hypothetical protein
MLCPLCPLTLPGNTFVTTERHPYVMQGSAFWCPHTPCRCVARAATLPSNRNKTHGARACVRACLFLPIINLPRTILLHNSLAGTDSSLRDGPLNQGSTPGWAEIFLFASRVPLWPTGPPDQRAPGVPGSTPPGPGVNHSVLTLRLSKCGVTPPLPIRLHGAVFTYSESQQKLQKSVSD